MKQWITCQLQMTSDAMTNRYTRSILNIVYVMISVINKKCYTLLIQFCLMCIFTLSLNRHYYHSVAALQGFDIQYQT